MKGIAAVHVKDVDILLYGEDKLPLEGRRKLEEHVGRCHDCAGRFAALARLPDVLNQPVPFEVDPATFDAAIEIVRDRESGKLRNLKFLGFSWRVALTGLSVVAIALTTYLVIPRHESSPFRATDPSLPMLRLFPLDGATITEPRPVFHWSSVAQTSVYKFSLMDEGGASVWNWDVRDTSLILPATVVLVPGKTYLWRVESFLADKTLERSALHVFAYAPSK